MSTRVLWAVVGGFLAGVLVRSFVPIGWSGVLFALTLAAVSLLLAVVERSRVKQLIVISVAFIAFSGGVARMHTAVFTGDSVLTGRLGQKAVLEGVVVSEPDVRDTGVRVAVHVTKLVVASTTVQINTGVLVLAAPHIDVSYGDNIRATGELRLPDAFDTGSGRQFHYPEYLAKDGIGYQLAFAQVETTGRNEGNMLQSAAIRVKQEFLRGLQAVLPEPEAGLSGGITVGDKRSIGKELSADFQRVSLIHMVVLSGYNITVVINAVRRMLLFAPRVFQYGGIAFSVVFVILMTGGASSAVRAGVMALVAVFARATGRVFLAGRILGVLAFCMVLWNPFTLAFDPGFQLSVLATLGLISFTPLFAGRLQWLTERFGLREIAASTLGTQLAVMPLLLYQNGQLSLMGVPANLLALLPVPLAMLASFIAAAGGMVFGSYAVPLALPAYVLLAYIIGIAQFFAALPFASVSLSAFSAWWMFAAYALMFGGLLWYTKKGAADGRAF